jgi:Ca2+-binding RTX toxin-like protein
MMTSFTITNEVTTAQVLNLDESGAVTVNGNLVINSLDNAVTMTDYAYLAVSGSIFSQQSGVASLDAGFITVGANGIISGFTSAIQFAGGITPSSTVINRGIIFGGSAIVAETGGLSLVNGGQITGDVFSAVNVATFAIISNSGEIFGATFGVETVGTALATITNTGVISGGTGALTLSDGASAVTNTGTLGGKSLLGGGADVFNGSGGTQGSVYGGTGADKIRGGAGDDTLFGDGGADILRGGLGDDALDGGTEADQMFGGLGDDSLAGGTGADLLRGGEGDDRLTGGTGVDTFVFTRGQGTDRITDFLNGTDKLDLRAFDFANVAAVKALASASSFGLRIDVPGEGVVFVQGLTLTTLSAGDVLL